MTRENNDGVEPGCYFITIGTRGGTHLFGSIYRNRMVLNDFGEYVRFEWKRCCACREKLRMDAFIVMPNHVHGILIIPEITTGEPSFDIAGVISAYREAVADRIRSILLRPAERIWEDTYRQRRMRCLSELEYLREAIRSNPAHWWEDELRS